ncbi:uncharacterized protein si:ch73-204p21.2 [Cyprinodon tularosa]|uniref:uncharacterized protein si:ch73-204p21.2 n=1 Tax=Cyprinodon tularosa TaxID=77115 RepID=UPI0018E25361|nr:uncharacterized protein si:ch73-204p21.2 [Cyprinodon tularosa]
MAALGAEVTGSWFLSPGLFGLLVFLLLLSIFLTALCSDCNRHSFELQDPKTEKNPSTLIRVVRLEEVRENPMMGEIQKDEGEFHHEGDPAEASDSQQGAPQTLPDPNSSEGTSAIAPPWRSHLGAPTSRDLNGSTPQASDHTPHTAGEGRGNSRETNRLSTQLNYISPPDDKNSVYARVSKKLRLANSAAPTAEEAEPQLKERTPPLPDRSTWVEDRERQGGYTFMS